MAHEGSFLDENGVEHKYTPIDWKETGEGKEREGTGENIDPPRTEEVVLEIENTATGELLYETIYGPFEDWDFIEDILEYDFGSEGSR